MADVCNTLGEVYEKTGALDGGIARAAGYYQKACEGRSSAGCLNLGLFYAAREDYARAVELYERACSDGWAPACHQLAATYEQGDGVARDVPRAVSLYTQACDGEHADSCAALGSLYASGATVPRNVQLALRFYGRAFKLYSDACDAGAQSDCTGRDHLRARMVGLSAGTPAANRPAPVR
jgi:hypothetical protein